MTEETQTQETTETTGQAELGIEPGATEQPDNDRDSPAFKGLKKQLREKKSVVNQLQSRVDELEAIEKQRTEAEMIANNDLQKLLDQREKELKDKEAENQAIRAEQQRSAIDLALLQAGITDEDARLGKTMRYLSLEGDDKPTIQEWIAQQKELNPESFETRGPAIGSPRVGDTTKQTPDSSLKARLKSKDKAVRDAAINEQGQKIWSGELAPDWDK